MQGRRPGTPVSIYRAQAQARPLVARIMDPQPNQKEKAAIKGVRKGKMPTALTSNCRSAYGLGFADGSFGGGSYYDSDRGRGL